MTRPLYSSLHFHQVLAYAGHMFYSPWYHEGASVYTHTCGQDGQHWYGKGDLCSCGQIPNRLLSAMKCDCGGGRLDPPEHERSCREVKWAGERNALAAGHPDMEPPLAPVPERKVRA